MQALECCKTFWLNNAINRPLGTAMLRVLFLDVLDLIKQYGTYLARLLLRETLVLLLI
jgi:hypothetical protein